MSIALLVLFALLVFGAWVLWQAYGLVVRKKYEALGTYKGAKPHQLPSLARSHGALLFAYGCWLIAIPFLVVIWRIPMSSWSALALVGYAGFFVGKRVIERKHKLEHS